MVRSRDSLEAEFRRVTPRSRAQWERGKPTMPGGIIKGAYWSPPYPIYVERARECYMWDLDGRRYVDFANHHTAMILGHSHRLTPVWSTRSSRRVCVRCWATCPRRGGFSSEPRRS